MQQRRLPFSIPHRRYNWFILYHWTVVSRFWLHHRLLMSTLNKHLQHLLLPRHWYAWNPLHASITALLCYFYFLFEISSTISFESTTKFATMSGIFFSLLATTIYSWRWWNICKWISSTISTLSWSITNYLCSNCIGWFKRCINK